MERTKIGAVACATLAALSGSVASAQVIADSAVPRNLGVQGDGGWQYGFYDGDAPAPFTPADFEQLPDFDFVRQAWTRGVLGAPGGYFTSVGGNFMHPHGLNGVPTFPAERNSSVVRYTMPASTFGVITWGAGDRAPNCGDGIVGRLFVNGVERSTQAYAANAEIGIVTQTVSECLPAGTIIDLAFDSGALGAHDCDQFLYFVRIEGPITAQPADRKVCPSGQTELSVQTLAPATYAWQRNGVTLENGPTTAGTIVAGANTANLVLTNIQAADLGTLRCQVTTACSTTTTREATLAFNDVDFNNDGVFPDNQDLIDFIGVFGGQDCPACDSVDFNGDGIFPDMADFEEYLVVFGGGNC
jgi:hypothetical protein